MIALHLSYLHHFELIPNWIQYLLVLLCCVPNDEKIKRRKNTTRNVQYSRKCFLYSIIHFHPKYWNRWESYAFFSLAQTHCKVKHIYFILCIQHNYGYIIRTKHNKHLFAFSYIETNILLEMKAQTRKSEFNNNNSKAQHWYLQCYVSNRKIVPHFPNCYTHANCFSRVNFPLLSLWYIFFNIELPRSCSVFISVSLCLSSTLILCLKSNK